MKNCRQDLSQPKPTSCSLVFRLINKFLGTDRGSIAIELALVIPLMLLILLGFIQLYRYVRAVSIVEHTAFTLADSISQMPQIIKDNSTSNANNLGALWSAAALIAQPNDLQGEGGVIVTSVCDQTTVNCGGSSAALGPGLSLVAGTPAIHWQAKAPWNQSGMTTRETPGNVLPATWPFRNGDTAIVVEVFYKFTPFTSSDFWPDAPGTQTIYDRVYIKPRDLAPGVPLELK
jgi:Flp pilus assembly protein TadG